MLGRALQLPRKVVLTLAYRAAVMSSRAVDQREAEETEHKNGDGRVWHEGPLKQHRQHQAMFEFVATPAKELLKASDILQRLKAIWKGQQLGLVNQKSLREAEEEVEGLAQRLLRSDLEEGLLIEAVTWLKQIAINSNLLPQEHYTKLRSIMQQELKSERNSAIVNGIAQKILSSNIDKLHMVRCVPLLQYLPANAGELLIRKIYPMIQHFSQHSILLLAQELVLLPYQLKTVPLQQLFKGACHQHSIYHSIDHIYTLLKVAERYGMQNAACYFLHFYNRLYQEPQRSSVLNSDQLIKIARMHRIGSTINIQTKNIVQRRHNRNKVLLLQHYIGRGDRFKTSLLMKIHLELSKGMHVGDFIIGRIAERPALKELLNPQNTELVIEFIKDLTKYMDTCNYTTVAESDAAVRIHEFSPPCSARILKLFSILIKEFIPKRCPQLLFRFNSPGKVQQGQEQSSSFDTYGSIKGINRDVPLIRIVQTPPAINYITSICLEQLDYSKLELDDIKNMAKFLANNKQWIKIPAEHVNKMWAHFEKLTTGPKEQQLEFLYYAGQLSPESLKKSVQQFRERIEPSLQGYSVREKLDDTILSIVTDVRQLHYLLPFLCLAFEEMPRNTVEELLQQHQLQLTRLANRWDSYLLHLNLTSLHKLTQQLGGYQPHERLMEAFVRNFSVFLVHVFYKRVCVIKYRFINDEFLPTLKWVLAYPWSQGQQGLKPFKTIGLQAVVNHLYEQLSLSSIQRFIAIIGKDRRYYLPETLKMIRNHHIKDASAAEVEEIKLLFDSDTGTSETLRELTVPPRDDATPQQHEQYLLKALHQRNSKYILRRNPQSRQELLLGVCLGVAEQIEHQSNFDIEYHQRADSVTVNLNKYRSEIGKIFNIQVANLDEQNPIKLEAVDQHEISTKVEFMDGVVFTNSEEKLQKYTHIHLPIYSAAEECLRGLMFGNPDFIDVAKHMNPPNIMTKLVHELGNKGMPYTVYGPIIELNDKFYVVTASQQSWRIRLIWAYVLEQQGKRVMMINTKDPMNVIDKQIQWVRKACLQKKK